MTAPPQTNKPRVLPLVVTTRDLVRWSGIHRHRLRRWMEDKKIPFREGGGPGGRIFNLEDIERKWPELLVGIRKRMERDTPDYEFFKEP